MPARPRCFRGLLATMLALAACAATAAPATDGNWLGIAHQLAGGSTQPHGGTVDFTPHGTQPGLDYEIQPEQDCNGCHGGNDFTLAFRPAQTWAGSMMANATRDPLFFAALDIANVDVPGVGDYCLRCHTSRGWYGRRVVKAGFGAPDNDVTLGASACLLTGGYDWPDNTDNDYSGLPCHYCHRLTETGPNGESQIIGNGNAWVDDTPCNGTDGEPCRRGPYDYQTGSPPPHPWAYSQFHTESRLCGSCHDVTSPDVAQAPAPADRVFADGFEAIPTALRTLKLADGTDTGLAFPIERTFSEWQQSQYAQAPETTCQSCHMPVSEDANATACSLGGYPSRTGDLPVHAFVGGNTWIPGVIQGEYSDTSAIAGSYGGVGRQDSFQQTIGWARDLLTQAAAVETSITDYVPPGSSGNGNLGVQVKVTNLSGHKLPSGYSEGRRMWLDVKVTDANGASVFESGAYDPATGVLTPDPQLRIYETLQGIWNHNGTGVCDVIDGSGAAMFHFVLSDCIAKDTRIPPLGFHPATDADPQGYELRPVGTTYPETSPGSGVLVNYDTVAYALPLPAGSVPPFTATARLYYQTSSREYIEFLRNQSQANGTPAENTLCAAGPNRPFVVGPGDRSRGEYMYQLWNNAPDDPVQPGYGKSPPELMQVGSASTP